MHYKSKYSKWRDISEITPGQGAGINIINTFRTLAPNIKTSGEIHDFMVASPEISGRMNYAAPR